MRKKVCFSLIAGLAVCAFQWAAGHDARIDIPWYRSLLDADFAGVVECETAGLVVAKYRVIETWKGSAKPGEILSLREETSLDHDWGPISLCGERFIVMANAVGDQRYGRGVVVLRPARSDYLVVYKIDRKNGWFEFKDFDTLERYCRKVVSLEPEAQETFLLYYVLDTVILAEVNDSLKWYQENPDASPLRKRRVGRREEIKRKLESISANSGLTDLATALLKAAFDYSRECTEDTEERADRASAIPSSDFDYEIFRTIEKVGGCQLLRVIQKLPERDFPVATAWPSLISTLQSRVKAMPLEPSQTTERGRFLQEIAADKAPTSDQLQSYRVLMTSGGNSKLSSQPFGVSPWVHAWNTLCLHDPWFVVSSLTAPVSVAEGDDGNEIAEWRVQHLVDFAGRCGKDRQKCLQALTQAPIDLIKAGAASYLCEYDPGSGKELLAQFRLLPGKVGMLASLELAKRGDGDAAGQVIHFLDGFPGEPWLPVRRMNLWSEFLTLVSNSCKASGVAFPAELPLPWRIAIGNIEQNRLLHREAMHGWQSVKDRIKLHDPWLDEKRKQ